MNDRGDDRAWGSIDFQPSVQEHAPHALLPFVGAGQRCLEIGCNRGGVSRLLAERGCHVVGIDINEVAVAQAESMAKGSGLGDRLHFVVGDVLESASLGSFDSVLLIRVLTCFPDVDRWRLLLERARSMVTAGGLLYVDDFALSENSASYRDRYADGVARGWRPGNFMVKGKAGEPMFVAHHHSRDEIREISAGYEQISLSFRESRSLHGNECQMFTFLGARRDVGPETAA